jgi:copper chaperone CopZ
VGGVRSKLPHRRFPQGSGYNGRRPLHALETLDKEITKNTMDPARPSDPDPANPFFPERADNAILETIEIATEGEDCDECVRKLRPVLKNISGVQDVKVDLPHERVIVTFDPRKTHPPDLHDAILKSGYKPAPVAD